MRRLMLAVLLIAACDNATTPMGPGGVFLVVSGDGQSGTAGQQLTNPLVVKATDSKGRLQRNAQVTFVITSGGGSANPASVRTDHNGLAQTRWTLGTSVSQAQSLEARAGSTLLGAFTATPLPGPAAQLAIQSGDGQSAVHNTAVAIAPSVVVRDQYGNGVAGASVTFVVTAGGGSVSGSPAISGSNGSATVGSWTLGSTIGSNALQASAPSVTPVAFSATATAGPAASMVLHAGNNQSAEANTNVPIRPAVRISDADGNPVSGVWVKLVPVLGGSFTSPDTVQSGVDGVATASFWLLGRKTGTNTMRVTAPGIADTVIFTATAIAGPPAAITIRAGNNQVGFTNTALPTSPSVIVKDAFNNVVAGATVTFAITEGNGAIPGTNPVTTDAAGIATVGGWVLGPSIGTNRMTATVDGMSPVTFTATAPTGPPAAVEVFAGNNQSGFPNTALPIRPAVRVLDAAGNPVAVVRVVFAVASGGGDISGSEVGTNSNGVATSGGWTLGPAPGVNTLSATVDWEGVVAGNPVTFTATGVTEFWTRLAPMTRPRLYLTGAEANGRFYALGGFDNYDANEAYDPASDTWESRAPIPTPLGGMAAASVNGIIYVVGGQNGPDRSALVQAYDPGTNSWSLKAPLPTPRSDHAMAAVDGILYVIGGQGPLICDSVYTWICDYNMITTVEAYDPTTDTWSTRADIPTPRLAHGLGVIDGIIYAVGGQRPGYNTWLQSVEAYDPVTNTWSTKADMPTGRFDHGVGVIDGILYAVGGEIINSATAVNEAYDPVANRWTTRVPMLQARRAFATAVIGRRLYAAGGNGSQLTLDAYQPQ